MTAPTALLVSKLWSYCNVLLDAGLTYLDYTEQLTYLLFLKMAHERTQEPLNQPAIVPKKWSWPELVSKEGDELEVHYRHTLEELGRKPGMLGLIFRKAQNKVQSPAILRRLVVDLIGQETWSSLDADVKGDAYEGLLERTAQEGARGAGQYFTPRALIRAMVDVIQPRPGETIVDPACGTGGFLIAANDYLIRNNRQLSRDQLKHLRFKAFQGMELTDSVARLCAMNLALHGIGPMGSEDVEPPILGGHDSLASDPGTRFSIVLTNPPFGRKSSIRVVNEAGEEERQDLEVYREDFWATTKNKQLNFVQHVKTLLAINGRAAVVVPDNVLFEGGAGETVRRKLLHECDVHTLLRLPTGIFYAQGVKANVLFFDRKPGAEKAWTKELWIYDLRTNKHFTLKTSPLARGDLDEFVARYNVANRHKRKETWSESKPEGRWRCYSYDEIVARDKASLDIFWLRDESLTDSATLPDPDVIASEIIDELKAALEEFEQLRAGLESPSASPPAVRQPAKSRNRSQPPGTR
jgi:type I restriction enzyme M protein